MKYIVKTENTYFECPDIETLDRKTNALTLLGFKFDIYELTKVSDSKVKP